MTSKVQHLDWQHDYIPADIEISWPPLTSLVLHNFTASLNVLRKLIKIPSLTSLELVGCSFTHSSFTPKSSEISPLQRLSFLNCKFIHSYSHLVLNDLLSRLPALQVLDLRGSVTQNYYNNTWQLQQMFPKIEVVLGLYDTPLEVRGCALFKCERPIAL